MMGKATVTLRDDEFVSTPLWVKVLPTRVGIAVAALLGHSVAYRMDFGVVGLRDTSKGFYLAECTIDPKMLEPALLAWRAEQAKWQEQT